VALEDAVQDKLTCALAAVAVSPEGVEGAVVVPLSPPPPDEVVLAAQPPNRTVVRTRRSPRTSDVRARVRMSKDRKIEDTGELGLKAG
jgi:hypothetical protein